VQTIEPQPTAAGRRPRGGGADVLVLVPGLAVLVVGAVLAVDDGGFAATAWYPAALIVLALAAVVFVATRPLPSETWVGVRGALAAFAAYVAWSYLSILWADIPGKAWDGANRSLLYLVAFGLVTLRPWSARAGRIGLAAVVIAVTGIGIGELIATAARANPGSLFLDGRLASPTGYSNATPDLWLIGALPAVWMACDLLLPIVLRATCAAAGTMLIELALLSQSRGSVLALVVGAIALVALAPRRWPALLALAVPLGATAISWSTLSRVQDAATPHGPLGSALHDARVAIVLSAVAVGVLAGLAALLDRRVAPRLGPQITRRGNQALAGLLALAAIVGIVAMGNPSTWVHDRWTDFKTNGAVQVDSGQSRLNGSLGSHRYDVYRVGLDSFVAHPVAGIGVDSFGPTYLVHGRTGEQPHYAHSLAISLLAETGIVGTALFLAFLALAVAAVGRAIRRRRSLQAVAGLAGFAVFLGGSLVDWLWQFPGLGVLAFALLGIAAVSEAERRPPVLDMRRTTGRVVARSAGIVAALAAALSLALPAIAARFTSSAYDVSATSPTAAVHRLQRAADLDPLSADPLLALAIVQRRLGRVTDAVHELDDAISREPTNWFAFFERGMLEARLKHWPAAQGDLARARALNPRQPVVGQVAGVVAAHRVPDPAKAESALAAQLQAKLHPLG
jgi:hypothetical protein